MRRMATSGSVFFTGAGTAASSPFFTVHVASVGNTTRTGLSVSGRPNFTALVASISSCFFPLSLSL